MIVLSSPSSGEQLGFARLWLQAAVWPVQVRVLLIWYQTASSHRKRLILVLCYSLEGYYMSSHINYGVRSHTRCDESISTWIACCCSHAQRWCTRLTGLTLGHASVTCVESARTELMCHVRFVTDDVLTYWAVCGVAKWVWERSSSAFSAHNIVDIQARPTQHWMHAIWWRVIQLIDYHTSIVIY